MLQKTTIHHLGSMYNGCIWCEIISQLRHAKHKFWIFLHVQEFLNAPKHNRKSFWFKWSRMDEFGAKPFPQLRYTKIVHSSPKQKFCISLHATGFLNAPKHNQTSCWVQWSRIDALSVKTFSQLRYSKLGHSCSRHKFCIYLHAEGFFKCFKRQPNIILGPME
jgi:hypothetical protein